MTVEYDIDGEGFDTLPFKFTRRELEILRTGYSAAWGDGTGTPVVKGWDSPNIDEWQEAFWLAVEESYDNGTDAFVVPLAYRVASDMLCGCNALMNPADSWIENPYTEIEVTAIGDKIYAFLQEHATLGDLDFDPTEETLE